MKIEQLEQLIRIVETGSMNEAAKKLYIARSSLSASMKNLEEELGREVLIRYTNGVKPTEFGLAVYNQAVEICGRVDYLHKVAQDNVTETLHIASLYCTLANDAMLELIKRRVEDSLDIRIEEGPMEFARKNIISGISELGIVSVFSDDYDRTMKRFNADGIEFHEMMSRNLYAVIGPRNPLYSSEIDEVDFEAMQAYPHVENYATPTDHSWEHNFGPANGYRMDIRVSDLGLAMAIVQQTDAFLIDTLDKKSYDRLYHTHNLKFIKLTDSKFQFHLGWIKLRGRELSQIAEEYLEILKEKIKANDEYNL